MRVPEPLKERVTVGETVPVMVAEGESEGEPETDAVRSVVEDTLLLPLEESGEAGSSENAEDGEDGEEAEEAGDEGFLEE